MNNTVQQKPRYETPLQKKGKDKSKYSKKGREEKKEFMKTSNRGSTGVCHYGSRCTREDCPYSHESERSSQGNGTNDTHDVCRTIETMIGSASTMALGGKPEEALKEFAKCKDMLAKQRDAARQLMGDIERLQTLISNGEAFFAVHAKAKQLVKKKDVDVAAKSAEVDAEAGAEAGDEVDAEVDAEADAEQ